MIGVTATAGAVIYYGRGILVPGLAAAAVVGVQVGSYLGMHVSARIAGRWLRLLLAVGTVCGGGHDVRGSEMSAQDMRHTEAVLGTVLTVGTRVSTACLALGLVLTLTMPDARISGLLLAVGLVVLMATPAARVVVSIAEFARQRDWTFVVYTSIVLALLLGSLVTALR